MKKKGRKVPVNMYKDLEGEVDRYEVDESDDGIDEEGTIMLENARGRRRKEGEEELFPVYHSSDEQSSSESMSDVEEDIGKHVSDDDGLPDSKAWGSKKKSFYDTDYVDQDYLDFDDKEAALMEEQEASEIQKRILSQLEQTDFSLGLLEKVEEKRKENIVKESLIETEKIEKDLTKMTKQQLIDVIKNETPGFFGLLKDCKAKLKYFNDSVLPILEMEENGELPQCGAITFLHSYQKMVNFYMMNTAFFLLLKSKREKTDGHPVIKRLGQISMYLSEMDSCLAAGLGQQIQLLLESKNKGLPIVEATSVQEIQVGKNRKEKRMMQQKQKEEADKEAKAIEKNQNRLNMFEEPETETFEKRVKFDSEDNFSISKVEEDHPENEKRAATYKMLKNKGLTPKRKKDVRNPRVKNKNKYKKAVIRRRGQVRDVKKEINRYGGELSGIKKYVNKSIKLK